MNEIQKRMAGQLLCCEAQCSFPGRIEALEIPSEVGEAEHIERGCEEAIQNLSGLLPFSNLRLQCGDLPAKLFYFRVAIGIEWFVEAHRSRESNGCQVSIIECGRGRCEVTTEIFVTRTPALRPLNSAFLLVRRCSR